MQRVHILSSHPFHFSLSPPPPPFESSITSSIILHSFFLLSANCTYTQPRSSLWNILLKLSLSSYIYYSIFFLPKSTNTLPTATFPVSSLQTLISGFNVCLGASAGISPSGKQISSGGGGLRMKSDPPGMKGTQYGSGWVNSNTSALPSCFLLLLMMFCYYYVDCLYR